MPHVKGKVVVVLNADTEIGAAIATRFLEDGACVILNGICELLRHVTDGADPHRFMWHEGDATRHVSLQGLLATAVERFGHIDAVINIVQPVLSGYFLDSKAEQWDAVAKAGSEGVFLATRLALPYLIASSGSMTNVAVRFDTGRDIGASAYESTREAIVTFTRSVAREFASEGVRLNVITPRITSTDAVGIDLEDKDFLIDAPREKIPIGRGAVPEEIASVVAFLASAEAAFVNGINLAVDGGFSGIGRA